MSRNRTLLRSNNRRLWVKWVGLIRPFALPDGRDLATACST